PRGTTTRSGRRRRGPRRPGGGWTRPRRTPGPPGRGRPGLRPRRQRRRSAGAHRRGSGGGPTAWPSGSRRAGGGGAARGLRRSRSHPLDLALLVGLDDVAFLEVLEVRQTDTALEPGADLGGVVLEPPQRLDRALPDDGALTQEADLGVARDDAALDHATGDLADAGHGEDLADLGLAGDDLFVLGGEHAEHGRLHVLEHLV